MKVLKEYVTVDLMEGKEYTYSDEIEQGFSLDRLLDERDRIGIPYELELCEGAKVIIIKDKEN